VRLVSFVDRLSDGVYREWTRRFVIRCGRESLVLDYPRIHAPRIAKQVFRAFLTKAGLAGVHAEVNTLPA
jgi:hypothetical protein